MPGFLHCWLHRFLVTTKPAFLFPISAQALAKSQFRVQQQWLSAGASLPDFTRVADYTIVQIKSRQSTVIYFYSEVSR